MRRRDLGPLFAGALIGSAVWPVNGRAQQVTKVPRIGTLSLGHAEASDSSSNILSGFVTGLRDLGYVEGQNIAIERRFADYKADRLREMAAALVQLKVDLIVTNSTTAARAAKAETRTIPIVAISMADPVGDELVANLARPGGNVTGTTFLGPELVAKRLQLLRDVVPGRSRIAALWHPGAYSQRTTAGLSDDVNVAARSLGLTLKLVAAESPNDLPDAFQQMTTAQTDALILLPSPMLFGEYRRIAQFAASNGLPAIGAAREFADFGGLMSYGVNLTDLGRQTATYADKILKGASPAELPVQQPVTFEFVINLKAASQLGLTISREFLLVADEVIE
jgi:putative ABC transport system substrate-binding protein